MKELQAKAKVTQTMTRDGLVVENQADGTVENVSRPSKGFKSGSDVTLGDFWGSEKILPFFDDDLGISVVMVNSNNGNFYMENVRDRLALYQVRTEDVLCHNSCLVESVVPHINRHDFFSDYEKGVLVAMGKQFKQSFVHNVIFKIVSTSKRIIGK